MGGEGKGWRETGQTCRPLESQGHSRGVIRLLSLMGLRLRFQQEQGVCMPPPPPPEYAIITEREMAHF